MDGHNERSAGESRRGYGGDNAGRAEGLHCCYLRVDVGTSHLADAQSARVRRSIDG
jgi:hypothetical protein